MTEHLEPLIRRLLVRVGHLRPVRRALLLILAFLRESQRDQLQARAATLSYWTLVTIVPVFVLVAAALEAYDSDNAAAVRELVFSTILAGAVREVGTALDGWIAEVNLAGLGAIGVLTVLLTSSRIWFSVEDAYNALWNTRSRRSLAMRMVLFYATFTVIPLLLGAGWTLSQRVALDLDAGVRERLVSLVLTTLAFVGAIRTLPDTRVRWGPAIVGGTASALGFELAKTGFNAYVSLVGAGDLSARIYGSLGLVPVFLLWLFLVWNIVLLGVELAWVAQRQDELVDAEERRLTGESATSRHADALFALQCLVVVAERFARGAGATSEVEVTRGLSSDPVYVRAALENLEAVGILAESDLGYLPARPLERLTVREVVAAYREHTRPPSATDAPGAAVVAALLAPEVRSLQAPVATLVGRPS